MALNYVDSIKTLIARDLHLMMQVHGTTDHDWDRFCAWEPGTTRALLDARAAPTTEQLIEICLRLNHPLSNYVRTAYTDF